MAKILILAGSCGAGSGSYEAGVFHMPDGTVRCVEDLTDLIALHDPDTGAVARRGGVARGLRDALAATGPLPRPFDLAATVLGLGLDALGGDRTFGMSLELHFADGATATIGTDAEGAAWIDRDREVVRLAALRRAAHPHRPAEPIAGTGTATEPGAQDPAQEACVPETFGPDARALASIFAYAKRGGRLRRLPDKPSGKVSPDEA